MQVRTYGQQKSVPDEQSKTSKVQFCICFVFHIEIKFIPQSNILDAGISDKTEKIHSTVSDIA